MIEISTEKDLSEEASKSSDSLSFLDGETVTQGELNTVTGGSTEDGVFTLNGDYMELQEKAAKGYSDKLEAGEIAWTINMLQRTQSQSNDGSGKLEITLNGKDYKLTAKQLQNEISNPEGGLKKEYQDAFYNKYRELGAMITGIDPKTLAFGDGSPLLLNSNNPLEEFNELAVNYDKLQENGLALDAVMSKSYEVAKENIDKAIYTDFQTESKEFNTLMRKAKDAGLPSIIYQDEDGYNRRYTTDEYKNVFADWAKTNGGGISVEGLDLEGFNTLLTRNRIELSDGTIAGIGHSKPMRYEFVSESYPGSPLTMGTTSTSSSGFEKVFTNEDRFEFNKEISDKQAVTFYNTMMLLNTLATTGKIQSMIDPEQLEKYANLTSFGNLDVSDVEMFKVFDINQALRGVGEADMNPGEILNNPVYKVILDPLNVTEEAAEFLKFANNAVDQGTASAIILAPTGFNEIQKNDYFQDPDSDVITASDDIDSEQLNLGRAVYNQYISDLRARRTTGSESLANYPLATIKYFPSWTSDGNNLDSKYSGYSIELSNDYISALRKDGGLLNGKEGFGNVISIVIPKTEDTNPRRYGEFNFSYVASEIAADENASFTKKVPGGGSFSITEDLNGQYNLNYQILQFNGETGLFDSATFTEKMENNQGMPLGVGNRNEIDFYMRQYLYFLQSIGENNINNKNNWIKSNPDKVITDPKYLFSN